MDPNTTPWLRDLLAEGDAYLVGGPVRDDMLGRPTNDLDILVAGIPGEHLEKILAPHGSVHLVGKSFGVFKFTPSGGPTLDLALPRREQSTGTGHRDFDVQVDPDIPVEDDLGRRDFTVNAMARSLRDGTLVDPHGGRSDLDARRLRQVFENTFVEDPLRLIRGVQFAARLDFTVEPETLEAMSRHAALVTTVSPERLYGELNKLFTAERPSTGFRLMHDTGLLEHVLPELARTVGVAQPEKYHRYEVFEHILHVIDAASPANLAVRWAALCHDLGKPPAAGTHPDDGRPTFHGHERHSENMARDILERLRAPEIMVDKVAALTREHMFPPETSLSDKALRRLIRRVGPEHAEDLVWLRRADRIGNGVDRDLEEWEPLMQRVRDELSGENRAFGRGDLKIDGKTLMSELGLDPGKRVGRILDKLLEAVVDDPSLNTPDKLLDLARSLR